MKLEIAARQALEALESIRLYDEANWRTVYEIITALREALAEQAECPHGVDDGACKECYMEQAEQEPVAMPEHEDFCYCGNEISLQMVSGGAAPEGLYGRVTLKVGDKYVNYYAAPVRTKDLTDDEILMCVKSQSIIETVRRAITADREKNK